jgi:hypothetical protein
MNEENQLVGGFEYGDHTTVHPVGLLMLIILGICIMILPRRWAVWPLLIMACFVSTAQRIVIAGMDFDFLRLIVLFGMIRICFRGEYRFFLWKPLDTVMVLWTISAVIFNVIQQGTVSAFVNRLGFGYDAFGMYFLFRCLIRDWGDVNRAILGVIVTGIPVAVLFLIENRTGRNIFSMFGGVPAITESREGRLRCQGAFAHAILAGSFWASQLPLFVAYWWQSSKGRIWAAVGIICSLVIIICSASSTPIMGILATMFGWSLFFLRRQMRIICWGMLLTLIALHMVMKAPVWHLISRVSAVGGSTGWHRSNLIDQTVQHFGDWWFSGCSGQTVASWGILAGDVTNQYILEGVRGGFLTMCLFITIIIIAFREVGKLWRSQNRSSSKLMIAWALGVSLFVHCSNFIGVSYFCQIWIAWYMHLAIIGSLSLPAANQKIRKTAVGPKNPVVSRL